MLMTKKKTPKQDQKSTLSQTSSLQNLQSQSDQVEHPKIQIMTSNIRAPPSVIKRRAEREEREYLEEHNVDGDTKLAEDIFGSIWEVFDCCRHKKT
jgi:hypothetical protein